MTDSSFSLIFLASLAIFAGLQLWLDLRQARHVARHRGKVPAAFANRIEPASHQRAADYTVARIRLARVATVLSALWLLALTLGGGIQAFHDGWSRYFAPGGLAHGLALLGSVALVGWLVELPITLHRIFRVEQAFGFNRMTPRLFLADTLKEAAVAVALGGPVLAAVLWIVEASGPHWWFYAWLFWMGLNVALMVIWPTFIAPLFNRFQPLTDTALTSRIEALLTRCGFRARGLFVMDGSRRSAHGNAYFTGLGAARRIVFFDTLLEKLTPDELEAVLAHELGHFRHRHVLQRLLLLALASLGLLALLGQLAQAPWFFAGLGLAATDTASALLLFALVLPVFLFPLGPLMSLWSRRHEYQADAYAVAQTSAGSLASALVKLYRDNASTLTPDPLYSTFHDSHPPAALRLARLGSAPVPDRDAATQGAS
ncbi:MAG: M48 family metallopeptidase [Rhodocyclaceae bacterium]|jgi:STE24 endopeptidase|nr:M48 family metallopeptidase [Rhodocyclaceae bacterium]